MSKYVFILGAGASRHAGAPLMHDFLDRAKDFYASSPQSRYSEDIERVFGAMSQLQVVHSKSEFDNVNLESVFSAFEMATLLDVSPGSQELLVSMKRLISWTLCEAIGLSIHEFRPAPSPAYRAFAEMISALNQTGNGSVCSIITFNYDAALDFALWHLDRMSPDYRLDKTGHGVPLFKLHGSINWGRCPNCSKIVIANVAPPETRADRLYRWKMFEDAGVSCCNQQLSDGCVIVPPTWDKSEYRSSLVNVWRGAAAELATASTIVVCGYSLPESDAFFRYLYGLGTVGQTLLERFWVFDPAETVGERFRALLGPGARARFEYRPYTFESAAGVLRQTLVDKSSLPRPK